MDIDSYKKRERHNVSERTLKTRVSVLNTFSEYIDGEPTVEDVEDFVEHLIDRHEDGEIKSSSIREYFKIVTRYFEVMGKNEDFDHIKAWLPDKDSDPGDYLKPEEYKKFRNVIQKYRDRALVDIMYYYARRPKEVILLNEQDVDFEDNTITFNILKKNNPRITKTLELENGEQYDVFRATFEIPDNQLNSVETWMQFKPKPKQTVTFDGEKQTVVPLFSKRSGRIGYSTVYNVITQASDRANIGKNITPKSIRHSRASHLDHAGQSPEQIARHQLLHDPSSDVISRYIHEQDEQDVREVMTLDDN